MDLGNVDSLRGVVARLRDAAADVDRMRGRAAQAIDTQEAQAGPGDTAVVQAMRSRWDEVRADLGMVSAALGDAAAILDRLTGQISDAEADWAARYAEAVGAGLTVYESGSAVQVVATGSDPTAGGQVQRVESGLREVVDRALGDQANAAEAASRLRLPTDLSGTGTVSFGSVELLDGSAAANIQRAVDQLARVDNQLAHVGARAR